MNIREALGRLFYIIPEYPHQAQIEITNRCNLNCAMCPRDYFKVPKEDMPFDMFKKIIKRLENVTLLTLTGWGEPLIHPHIFEMITYGKGKGYKVKLTTNGVLLNADFRHRVLTSGLDEITISLESVQGISDKGHTNPEVLASVKDLVRERKGELPSITLQATLHKGRAQDIYEVVRFGREAGVERINLGRLDVRYSNELERPSVQEEKALLKEADRLGEEFGIRVDSIQYALFNGIERTAYKLLKPSLHRFGSYCLKLYDYIYVNQRAEVTPCCGMPHYRVGNLLKEELGTIWKGKDFHYFREHHHQLCGSCDLWRIAYGGHNLMIAHGKE